MNWSYVAGFFDGEGHVAPASHVEMAQKFPEVLERIKTFLEAEGIPSSLVHNETTKSWILTISRRGEVKKFIRGVIPFSIVKKSQLQDNFRYFTLFPSRSQHEKPVIPLDHRMRLWHRLIATGKLSQKDFAETSGVI